MIDSAAVIQGWRNALSPRHKFKVGDRLRALESVLRHKGVRRAVVPGQVVVVKNLESPWETHEGKPAYGFEDTTQWYHEEHFELVLHAGASLEERRLIPLHRVSELERRERIQLASLREAHRKASNVEVNHRAQVAKLERKLENLRAELVKRDSSLRAAKDLAAGHWSTIAKLRGLVPVSVPVSVPTVFVEAGQPVGLARESRKLWVSVAQYVVTFGCVGVRWVMPVVAVAVIALAVVKVMG